MKPQEVKGSNYGLCYSQIPKEENKFVDVRNFLPITYDLLTLKIYNGKTIVYKMGWWTGTHWDGYKILHKDKVVAWRKSQTEFQV